jgi:hypothetical protein
MKTQALITGSCECGRVRYVLTPPSYLPGHCSCAACAQEAPVPLRWCCISEEQLRWIEGEGGIARVPTETKACRTICIHCEQTLYYDSPRWPGELHIAASTLDPRWRDDTRKALEWCPRADSRPSFESEADLEGLQG